ncbi:hypothetical protein CA13_06250 [Planctomycetes bacterium CA13]|uniref:Competence protein A n=1 Tax=Novipirellula herctigrandis TaxID=2527986 RepID=A0A5C5YXE0_9BACT|nr:hypothetical protein CA13_06250 [Planctomycetes bacterium CA13]
MSRRLSKQNKPIERTKLFGLWIENRMLQVAIATPINSDRYRLEIDYCECPFESGWLDSKSLDAFSDAIESLVEKHGMRRGTVAVSLDGDFCVSRIALGNRDAVEREVQSLDSRVPRYLQLGPGVKVTGQVRQRVDDETDYAITSVVNQSLIGLVYGTFRAHDVELAYVEPSLVSISRLIGQSKACSEHPVLIADGTGLTWDVGIVFDGRLILDYRPAAAASETEFHAALDGHISRLHRFCNRYLGIKAGQLDKMLICGSEARVNQTIALFQQSGAIKSEALRVPRLDSLYEIDEDRRHSHSVPAVASVLPLMLDIQADQVPDLLTAVRREPDQPLWMQSLRVGWPAIAALVLCLFGFGILTRQRSHVTEMKSGEGQVQATVTATQSRMHRLAGQRERINYLHSIAWHCQESDWGGRLKQITQSLPDTARLNEFRVEDGRSIRIDGSVFEERLVYDILAQLEQLPGVAEVALHNTTPDTNSDTTRFVIRLTMVGPGVQGQVEDAGANDNE